REALAVGQHERAVEVDRAGHDHVLIGEEDIARIGYGACAGEGCRGDSSRSDLIGGERAAVVGVTAASKVLIDVQLGQLRASLAWERGRGVLRRSEQKSGDSGE